jgi:DNA-binding GntR family transcriptional regulator
MHSMQDVLRISRRPLHEEAVDRLRDQIVQGRLGPGERLNERLLCERFGISRTPLREAIKLLATEGLVDLLPNRGAVVSAVFVAWTGASRGAMASNSRAFATMAVRLPLASRP